ncbi:MAG: hypothetical protein ABSG43_11395 [Solirubrobacteraceae bacterium]
MSNATTIREQVHDALHRAGPEGLTIAVVAGAVQGRWRSRDVEKLVRKLWQVAELGRRRDGTFVLAQKPRAGTEPGRARREPDAAVKRIAASAQRDGHSTKVTTRTVDPPLLRAFCVGCRKAVHPRLDGTCPTCGHQTATNQQAPAKRRRRRRLKALRERQPGFGTVCRCGAAKSKQAHLCRACSIKRRRGRKLTLPAEDRRRRPKAITDSQRLGARRLYATGLSLRQIAAQIHADTSYKSVASCAEALYSLFKTRGCKLGPQREVTRARSTKHARKPRKQTREQHNAYRRWLANQRGWHAIQGPGRPLCKGVKLQPPGNGNDARTARSRTPGTAFRTIHGASSSAGRRPPGCARE